MARRWNWLRVRTKIADGPAVVGRALAAGNAVYGLTAQVGHGKDTRPEPDPSAWPSPV